MIPFVERKEPAYEHVRELLAASAASGTWSNFGPASLQLETASAGILGLPDSRQVVACASGTVALHGLVHLYEHLRGRALRWVVSAYTFHAQRQGPLATARVADCDAHGILDVDALAALDQDSYDGLVVTHLFGSACPIDRFEELAARTGKVLLFDSATGFGARHRGLPIGRFGAGEVFSFHHTKPCGFGEGGCAVVPTSHADTLRSLMNFGLYKGIDTGWRSSNGKMSDVAAAFILDRLQHREAIRTAYGQQFRRIAAIAHGLGLALLTDGGHDDAFPNLAAVLFPREVRLGPERLSGLPLVLHKYYRPLAPLPRANDIYARVVCFPCHAAVGDIADDALRGIMRALAD